MLYLNFAVMQIQVLKSKIHRAKITEADINYKGSITIDGVSLTVNDVTAKGFRLTIIPHTLAQTLIGTYKIGRRVNIETDMFARYLHHMFQKKEGLDWNSVDRIMAIY